MTWFLFTILAILSRSFQSITSKIFTDHVKVKSSTQSVLFLGTALILSLPFSPLIGGITFKGISDLWLPTIIMVSSQALGNILFFEGLSKLQASVTAIAFSSILLWGSILSVIFLGSSFALQQIIGILLLGVAIVLVQDTRNIRKIDSAIIYVIASAMFFAVFQVSSAELAKTMPGGTYLLLSYGGAILLTLLVYKKQIKQDLKSLTKQKSSVTKAALLAGTTSAGYFIFSFQAYRHAPDRGVVVVLLTSQVILSVILGIVLLKERDHLTRKITAGLIALLAGLLIKS